jgi:hypothetical protein
MTIVSRKISLFGDSVALNKAARIYAYNTAKFGGAGYNDCAQGGHRLSTNLNTTTYKNQVATNVAFPSYIQSTDDGDIVIIHLGSNDPVISATGGEIGPGPGLTMASSASDYVGCDALTFAANLKQHVQYIRSVNKRPVIIGMPYYNADRALVAGGAFSTGTDPEARGVAVRLAVHNVACRIVAGLEGVPFIATYGFGGAGGHPSADYDSTTDGVHPTTTYNNAVADYIAQQLISIFSL